jgi:hypothetical protein
VSFNLALKKKRNWGHAGFSGLTDRRHACGEDVGGHPVMGMIVS